MDAVKAELNHALEREYPASRNRAVKWDAKDGTFQVEKEDADAPNLRADALVALAQQVDQTDHLAEVDVPVVVAVDEQDGRLPLVDLGNRR